MELVIFDTLVFGAASSPTVWGRFASFLARAISAVEPKVNCQLYVDDPAFSMSGTKEEAITQLTNVLLWTNLLGYPIKMSKSVGGKSISWIGAEINLEDVQAMVEVTISQQKVTSLWKTRTDSSRDRWWAQRSSGPMWAHSPSLRDSFRT